MYINQVRSILPALEFLPLDWSRHRQMACLRRDQLKGAIPIQAKRIKLDLGTIKQTSDIYVRHILKLFYGIKVKYAPIITWSFSAQTLHCPRR